MMYCSGNSEEEIRKVKSFLNGKFSIKDMQQAKYLLGLEIIRFAAGLYVNQRKYAVDLINDAGLMGANPLQLP